MGNARRRSLPQAPLESRRKTTFGVLEAGGSNGKSFDVTGMNGLQQPAAGLFTAGHFGIICSNAAYIKRL